MKLYVGNLNYKTLDDDLRVAFSPYGEIEEARVIVDRHTGRSRGFGFVTFSDSDSAQEATSAMNGTELDGRTLRVNEAKERSDHGNQRPSRGREQW